jgi:hypothetical protein
MGHLKPTKHFSESRKPDNKLPGGIVFPGVDESFDPGGK